MKAPISIMAHLVAGYTSDDIAFAAARGLVEGGVSFFEVQFPFSDPSADGKAIQTACASVLSRGWRVDEGFAFVAELRRRYPAIPVFVMTYANLAWKNGLDSFVARSASVGISGLIIPDLPFDADEGLALSCRKHGLVPIPVAAPSMTSERISLLASLGRPYIYAALRAGITGQTTVIDDDTLKFLSMVSISGAMVLGGFGIRNGEQSRALSDAVHSVVAGSVFVDLIRENSSAGPDAVTDAIRAKAAELSGICQ